MSSIEQAGARQRNIEHWCQKCALVQGWVLQLCMKLNDEQLFSGVSTKIIFKARV